MRKIAVLIMAAGEANRFGSCKQLAKIDNKSLLQRIIDEAKAVAHDQVYVVTGRYHDEICRQASAAEFLFNSNWKNGLGSSISSGVSQIGGFVDGILIVLADQIHISETHLRKLIMRHDGKHIVCARYAGKNGVPE